ncbi:actin-like protein, putative [Plasmodium berghei]|uniref:Actin-like protein, putative n=2 Tax=Plasmodium berghei TaxID=5821 RepID=A0A509AIH3_PLABA|nr:actin-like protein, putative [Plasmodium berghei ANKA]CXI31331.1 actin-like protein, putative [Plasmodium berghei]SCM20978.1 actin-like protein, putative [Plasmodium berghei]SCN24397.1 actin-like protein, putative [Plasmodium berghei]SCO59586.1 actin-like protein, putative [Plasmodium berghei]SCO60787.1 actin-like protein, putative [Plasmodium berghei]|eukprot:XP_034421089.1 actin-like protein, putative [Plasmodium berghei ANKA]
MSMNKKDEIPTLYSPIEKNLYGKLNNPIEPYIYLEHSLPSSEKKKKLNRRISFSSFSNTTCSDILKLNNYLDIKNNILLLSLNNYSFKVGLVNKYDYTLQSLRLPQMEIIETWRELGYMYPPYKNYDILEECIYHCFSNIYKMDLKDQDLFIPLSSKNNMKDFSAIGDILFNSFQVKNIAFKEPSFVSSLIILEELKKKKSGIQIYREETNKECEFIYYNDNSNNHDVYDENQYDQIFNKDDIDNEEEASHIENSSCNLDSAENQNSKKLKQMSNEQNKKISQKDDIKNNGKEKNSNESLIKLRELDIFNFTALLVNIGSTKTTCTPVINGIPLPDLTSIYYIGGYDIDNQIYDEMKKNEMHQKEISMNIAKIAKEKRVFTPQNKDESEYLSILYNKNPKNYFINSYELYFNKIFASAVNSTEIFFSQYYLDNYLKTDSYNNLHKYDINFNPIFTQATLPLAIYNTIQKCPIDFRKELFNNIYLTGGSSIIPGFRQRLENELYEFINSKEFYNKTVINVHALKRKLLQKYSIYVGSHYFLEFFDYYKYNISKQDYEEYGESILEKLSLQGKLLY